MFAFMEDRNLIREVCIPDTYLTVCGGDVIFGEDEKVEDLSDETILALVFKWGQNDLQQKHMPSVSVGDVVELRGKYWMVMSVGWRELTKKEFDELIPPTAVYAMGFDIDRA